MTPPDIDRFNGYFHRRPQCASTEKIMNSTALATAADNLDAKWERTKKAWAFALRSGGFRQAARGELRLKHYDPKTGQPLYSPSGVLFEVIGLKPAIIYGTAYYSIEAERGRPAFAVVNEPDIGDAEAAALMRLCGYSTAIRYMLKLEMPRGRSFAEFADFLDDWF